MHAAWYGTVTKPNCSDSIDYNKEINNTSFASFYGTGMVAWAVSSQNQSRKAIN